VNGWFDKAKGLALGVMLMGTGITATFGPAFVTAIIERFGWRMGYLALAAVVMISFPLVVWLVRTPPWEPARRGVGSTYGGVVFGSAVRTRVFWQLMMAFALQALGIGGLVVHFIPLLTDQGVGRLAAASTAGIIGIAVISGRLIVGALVDYLFAPRVAAVTLVLSGFGVVGMALAGPLLAPLAAFALGFAVGAEVDLMGYLCARYFGLASYGRIYGLLYGAFILGTGISPLWVGLMFDHFGTYKPALGVSVVLLALVVIWYCTLPDFPRATHADGHEATTRLNDPATTTP
jgi:predicted MFS family arabinose efflux permease